MQKKQNLFYIIAIICAGAAALGMTFSHRNALAAEDNIQSIAATEENSTVNVSSEPVNENETTDNSTQDVVAPMPDENFPQDNIPADSSANQPISEISSQETIEPQSDLTDNATGNIAQEENLADENEANDEVEKDENITAEDLEADDPTILPDSKFFYPIKNIWRNFLIKTTFNPVKKAQLRLRFASEKLIETAKIAKKTDNPEIIERAIDNYKNEIEKIQNRLNEIKEQGQDLDNLIEKIADNQIKHSILIDKIEKNIPDKFIERISAKIDISKDQLLKGLSTAAINAAGREKLGEKLQNAIEKRKGSDFKQFRHLEILKTIEESIPEKDRDEITKIRENTQKRFEKKFAEIPESKKRIFRRYIKKMGGNAMKHLEIISDLENEEIPDDIRQKIEQAKEEALKRVENRLESPRFEKEKEKMLKRLESGNIKSIRMIKMLENNFSSPKAESQIAKIKNIALENFKRKIQNADSRQQQKILDEISKVHNATQLAAMKEIDKIIPEDKKEFWGRVREKAKNEIENEIKKAGTIKERSMIIQKLAGDAPEDAEVLNDFISNRQIVNEIKREQIEKITRKIKNIKDPAKLKLLNNKILNNKSVQEKILKYDSGAKIIPTKKTNRNNSAKATDSSVCIQKTTYAKNPQTEECKQFPTPCNVPDGWNIVENCKKIQQTANKTIQNSVIQKRTKRNIQERRIDRIKEKLAE